VTPPQPVTFAIPGDIRTRTGGYIYERHLLEGLRAAGRQVRHMELPGSYPDPPPAEMDLAVAALQSVGPDRVLLLDGFVSGATSPAGLARVAAPMVAIVHHPLALEAGLPPARSAHLFETERQNLTRMRHVLVPSPHTKRILAGEYGVPPEKITIVRPGADRPAPGLDPGGPARTPPLILSVGILHPRKGHDVLIAALDHVAHLAWHCVIVGRAWDKEYAGALARQIEDSGLGDRVTLAGEIDQSALDRFYRRAALFALATRYEGYGIVFGEALTYGVPIVACRTGAVPDTVPEDTGLLVPPDDARAFARALGTLLGTPGRLHRMRLAASRAGAALPDWTDQARRAGTVLDNLHMGRGADAAGGHRAVVPRGASPHE